MHHSNWKRIAIVAVIVVATGLVGYVLSRQPAAIGVRSQSGIISRKSQATSELERQWGKHCDPDGPTQLSHSPIAPEDLDHIAPYGLMSDAHVTPVDHQYWVPKNATHQPSADEAISYPIVAPADGRIVSIQHFGGQVISDRPDAEVIDDYYLAMQHSCTLYSYLIHMTDPSAELLAAAGHEAHEPETWVAQIDVPIAAGEQIGTNLNRSFDFAVMDTAVTVAGLLRPALYQFEPWKVHTVDPLAYFPVSVAAQLETKMVRQVEPRSGRFDYDVAGTAQGNWFVADSNGYRGTNQDRYWSTHLAIAPHYIDPVAIIVSHGNVNGRSRQFMVTDPDFHPDQLTAEQGIVTVPIQEFELVDASGRHWTGLEYRDDLRVRAIDGAKPYYLKLQILPEETLLVELMEPVDSGKGAEFSERVVRYVR